ncbi:VWA-like domain-containing protein [Moorellaceae bacterium AZ2]
MSTLPQEIQAARLLLVTKRPYLASAAWALCPVKKPGLGTMAVDQWWRLYYDPEVITCCTTGELAGVLYHEISHLLRDHPSRMKGFDPRLANIATDAEINDDLLTETDLLNHGITLPGQPITPATIGQPEGLLAEEYYAALEQQAQQSAPRQGTPAQSEHRDSAGTGAGKLKAAETRQEDGNAARQRQSCAPADNSAGADSARGTVRIHPDPQDDASSSKAGDAGGSKLGDGVDSMSTSSSTQSPASSTQPEASSQSPTSPIGNGGAGGQDGGGPGDGVQTPAPGAGRCGSCATGHQEPWEEGPPGSEGASPGISWAEAELIRRDVARQIKEHCRAQGEIPGHWARWAEEKLRPKVDWRKELASAVRHAIADVSGASDYSYRRPSRRQGQIGNGRIIFPALRRPIPNIAVVVDTSASISDRELAQALAEVSGILRALGQQGVTVLAVDTMVHACRRVFRPEQVKLAGGGGTDMGVGLYAAYHLRPKPQIVIVLTDGYTPWPACPPRGMKVIVALLGDGSALNAPEWAKTIRVKIGGGAR